MKKIFSLLLFSTLIASCFGGTGQKASERQRYVVVEEDYLIEKIFSEAINEHPNFDTNDLTRKELNDAFMKAAEDSLLKHNIFEGIPVKIRTLNKNDEGKYAIHLYSWYAPAGVHYRYNIDDIMFDVVGFIPDTLAYTLDQEKDYIFKGKYLKRITFTEILMALDRGTIGVSDDYGIRKDYNKYDLSFRYMLFDIESIEPFTGRKKDTLAISTERAVN